MKKLNINISYKWALVVSALLFLFGLWHMFNSGRCLFNLSSGPTAGLCLIKEYEFPLAVITALTGLGVFLATLIAYMASLRKKLSQKQSEVNNTKQTGVGG